MTAFLLVAVLMSCSSPAAEDAVSDRAGEAQAEGQSVVVTDPDDDQDSNADADAAPDPEVEQGPTDSFDPVRIDLPLVPAIVLPDLSVLSAVGQTVEDDLGDFASPTSGVDVVSADCVDAGGELEYQGRSGDSFFDIEDDGSGSFAENGEAGIAGVQVNPDGSGTYSRLGDEGILIIDVKADGSGTYSDNSDGILSIEVAADGTGVYTNNGDGGIVRIEVNPDGSGLITDNDDRGILNVAVEADGSGSYSLNGRAGIDKIDLGSDGSWIYDGNNERYGIVGLEVRADGSGTFTNNGPNGVVEISAESDGNGGFLMTHNGKEQPTSEIGILDPAYVIAGPVPAFAIADRFPPLDTLGSLQPPCATVLRLDADVLFDFDSDQLKDAAGPTLDAIATSLAEGGSAIVIQGHTDSLGSDEYNLDLSERRAESVAAALVERGVTAQIDAVGFGETVPVAPNETSSGEDDPAGRQLNRRVEIVLSGE